MEGHTILIGLTSILLLGIGAQWISWQVRVPSILLLLIFGFIAGPVTGLLNPDTLFGDLLFPIVSLFVAIILFEGGLNLRLDELGEIGTVVRDLIVIGGLGTWILCSAAAYFLLDFSIGLSVLQGAILVVTGPTVVIPLLKHVRPKGRIGSIARWEGILMDPIGAILAVIIFEGLITGGFGSAGTGAIKMYAQSLLIGAAVGGVGAFIMYSLLKRYWVPDYLQNSVSLMLVVATYTASNLLFTESGLLATTVMGVAMANQKTVRVKHIVEFKEDLRVLLISTLFILLAARLEIHQLVQLSMASIAFLAVLILVIRPAVVGLATVGSDLTSGEKGFLAWLAPRGIVAAAVSAVFGQHLAEAGYAAAERLMPVTFLAIAGTVAVYGLTAAPLAHWLNLADVKPQGTLILGAHSWVRKMARFLQDQGFDVRLIDANRADIAQAQREGLDARCINILSESALDELDLDGMGHMLAMTSNDEVNTLAVLHMIEVFDRAEVFQLAPYQTDEHLLPKHLRGRFLFDRPLSYQTLDHLFSQGAELETLEITEENDSIEAIHEAFSEQTVVPLFLIDPPESLSIFNARGALEPEPGQKVIVLVAPPQEDDPKVDIPFQEARASATR